MTLATLQAVKTSLGISYTDTSEDAALQQWITQIDAAIFQLRRLRGLQHGRRFTEFYRGHGKPELKLKRLPVRSITSIYWDDGTTSANHRLTRLTRC